MNIFKWIFYVVGGTSSWALQYSIIAFGLITVSCNVLICLSRLLFTLKPLLQTPHWYGRSPVWVRLCINMLACDGNVFVQVGQTFRPFIILGLGRLTEGNIPDPPLAKLFVMANCSSVCAFWMCRTQSPGVWYSCWQSSHRKGGNSPPSSSSYYLWLII